MDISKLTVQERVELLALLMQDKEIGAYVAARAEAQRAEYEANWKPPVWDGEVDWSQAPEWAQWWACDRHADQLGQRAGWFRDKPELGHLQGGGYWQGQTLWAVAPVFGFPEDTLDSRDFWKTSLRQRPA